MSKVGDIKKMYGQDFSIVVTNAPAEVINNYTTYSHGPKLLSNILLISSPMNKNQDTKQPTLFVTDYNGEPLQLTYSFAFGNGLKPNKDGNISMTIDNNTIKSSSTGLYVNTKALDVLGNNRLGLAKTNTNVDRNDPDLPDGVGTLSFITNDQNGTLYLASSFFSWLDNYIKYRINEAIKPLITTNLSGWIKYNGSNYNNGENISISSNQTNNVQSLYFDFYYKSTDGDPESVTINNDLDSTYPLFMCPDNLMSQVDKTETIGDENIYTHKVSGINLLFYPNLNLVLNESYPINYNISIIPDSWTENSINTFSIKVYQDKLPNKIGMNIEQNYQISIHEMVTNVDSDKTINFKILNDFANLFLNGSYNYDKLYDGNIVFSLNIYYKYQNNLLLIYENNNISNYIAQNTFIVPIPITSTWLDLLVNKNANTEYIQQFGKYTTNVNLSTEYVTELKINIKGIEKTYKSTSNIKYNTNVITVPKISDLLADVAELMTINGETVLNTDYTNSSENNSVSTIDKTSINIFAWDKLTQLSNNNSFTMNINYIVKTSLTDTPDSFVITNNSDYIHINASEYRVASTDQAYKTFYPVTLEYEYGDGESLLDSLFGGDTIDLTFSSDEFVSTQKSVHINARFDNYILTKENCAHSDYTQSQYTINEYKYIKFYQLLNDINLRQYLEVKVDDVTDLDYYIYDESKDITLETSFIQKAYIYDIRLDNSIISGFTVNQNNYNTSITINNADIPSENDEFTLTIYYKLNLSIESDKILPISYTFKKQQTEPNNTYDTNTNTPVIEENTQQRNNSSKNNNQTTNKQSADISFISNTGNTITSLNVTNENKNMPMPTLRNNSNVDVTFSSSNNSVAIVTQTGTIIIVGNGVAIITATATETSTTKTTICELIINVHINEDEDDGHNNSYDDGSTN